MELKQIVISRSSVDARWCMTQLRLDPANTYVVKSLIGLRGHLLSETPVYVLPSAITLPDYEAIMDELAMHSHLLLIVRDVNSERNLRAYTFARNQRN